MPTTKILPIVVLLLNIGNALISVPFNGTGGFYAAEITFQMGIGSPAQNIDFNLHYNYSNPGLYVKDARIYNGVGFNPDLSSTFTEYDPISNGVGEGYNATDQFVLNGTKVGLKPIQVNFKASDWFTRKKNGIMGIYRYNRQKDVCHDKGFSQYCMNFIELLLVNEKEKVMTLAFDKFRYGENGYSEFNFTGQISFGNKIPEACSNNWNFIPENGRDSGESQWTFNMDKFSVGKYTWLNGGTCQIDFKGTDIQVPSYVYDFVLNVLGAKLDTIEIPCKQTKDIVFVFNGQEFRIHPETYVVKNDYDQLCYARINKGPDSYSYKIPITAFSNRCLLLDYTLYKYQIGLSERV